LTYHNAKIGGVIWQKAPSKMKLVTPDIQNDIVHIVFDETTNKIIEELGEELFSMLVDKFSDVFRKEQIDLRFISKQESIV
jgi:Domain of unknown function (DUF4371)